ncbi:MAG: bifunctional oligoribonuclease/PAP phosphatase NrnA [Syntrophomonadaceae bacterium]|jgi:phosphoesterase RecJ-like protein|nr:bifunctional oligoribonuclease/PAP phosphatase NrnA [Syntrophomonadaceae bacterium]
MKNNTLQEISSKLLSKKEWLITGHSIPDGDCVGSVLGLYHALKAVGKEAAMLLEDPIPEIYGFIEGARLIKKPDELENIPDAIVCLDCSDLERMGNKTRKIISGCSECINIDHHMTNSYFGDLNYVDIEAAATGEIIVDLLSCMEADINTNVAQALFSALVTDSGSFMNNNTTAATMKKAAVLLESGLDISKIRVHLFESKPELEVLLLRYALNSISFHCNKKIACMHLFYEDMKELGALDFHPEGIIDYTRRIEGVEIGILFREIAPGLVKVGFRAKNMIDVALLAQNFGGGGHRQAAGAKINGNINEVMQKVLLKAEEVLSSCKGS